MSEELINIVLFYESAHRKVIKSHQKYQFVSAPPLHVMPTKTQANSAEQRNFQKSSLKCFEIY